MSIRWWKSLCDVEEAFDFSISPSPIYIQSPSPIATPFVVSLSASLSFMHIVTPVAQNAIKLHIDFNS